MFGSTKLYPWFVQTLGFHGTFWMYGGVMIVEVRRKIRDPPKYYCLAVLTF